jgi:uncharacterized protein YmfQ (DUF2313 family)
LQKVVYGLAGIMGFADGRAADLLERESDPRKTIELLPDWERNWGLPDPCFHQIVQQPDGTWIEVPQTIGERQKMLVMRMTILGAQSRAFFESVASFLGYDISISEYRPFMVGVDRCGDARAYDPVGGSLGDFPCQLGNPNMRFAWTVHILSPKLVWFRVSLGQCGVDPHLRIMRAQDLECIMRRWAPAHTVVIFDYSKIGDPWAATKQSWVMERTGDFVTDRFGTQVLCQRQIIKYYLQIWPIYELDSPTFGFGSLLPSYSPPIFGNPYDLGTPIFATPTLT